MNNNVILNWPGIKVIRQVKVSTMIREHLGYLGRINKRIVSTDEIPGFGNLVSDWESGLNNLKNHRVIFLLGVGMMPHNVESHIDYLRSFGVEAITFEWPKFEGDMASFKAQSDWLVKQIDKPVILVGHSLGHLVGLQFAHDYPEKTVTFLGSGGPTRSHDDILPLDLVEFLQKIEKLSGEDGYQHLAQKFKLSRLVAQTNGGLGSMARIYLAHLLPPTPDYFEKLYSDLPENLLTHYRYGLNDRTVICGVGMSAVFQANNAEIVFDPNAGHKMYTPEDTLKVLGHLLSKL